MKDDVKLAVDKFRQAWLQLEAGVKEANTLLEKDGVVQRFEFTFELLWKTLKIYFESQGTICKTPRECLKTAFRLGFLADEAVFLDMLEDRNKMSHMYDREWASEIFERIKNKYVLGIKGVLKKINEEIDRQ